MVSDERGQLILVGAIAIALVVLGLVLIVNTALFTQVVGSEGTIESAKEGGTSGQEIGDAIGTVVAETNRGDGDPGNIVNSSLESAFANRSLEESGSFVSLAYLGEAENGTLMQQDSVEPLNPTGSDDWSPITNGEVGEFLLSIKTEDSTDSNVVVNATSISTGNSTTLEVSINDSEQLTLSGANAQDCTAVGSRDGTIRLDVRHGTVYEYNDCTFDLLGGVAAPYNISFEGGDDVHATYNITTNQTSISPDPPSTDSITWAFEYGFTYDSTDATVESESRVIDVYD